MKDLRLVALRRKRVVAEKLGQRSKVENIDARIASIERAGTEEEYPFFVPAALVVPAPAPDPTPDSPPVPEPVAEPEPEVVEETEGEDQGLGVEVRISKITGKPVRQYRRKETPAEEPNDGND